MQEQSLKPGILSLAVIFCLGGCIFLQDVGGFLKSEGPPSDDEVVESYNKTELKTSSAADVLEIVHLPEYELLSQSESVIASTGQKKKGYKAWFNMVAFDENELTARRKYVFIVDEKPKVLFTEPWTGIRFDCETVMEQDVLEEPYANENARRIAILRKVLENFRDDMDEVESDNKALDTSGMLVNQALETVLVKLDASPVLAIRLSEESGVEFDHISLDKGKIQMVIEEDIVTIKLRLGSLVKKWVGEEMEKEDER